MIRDKALKSRLESVADSTFTSRFSLCKHFQNPFVKNNILYKIAEQKMWLSRFGIAFFTFLANLLDRAKGPIPWRLYDILMWWSSIWPQMWYLFAVCNEWAVSLPIPFFESENSTRRRWKCGSLDVWMRARIARFRLEGLSCWTWQQK